MADALLRADRITVRHGTRTACSEVSLQVDAGTITCILGPNGAGKSSLLRALAGLLPHDGSVHLQGKDARQLGGAERARRLAYVPQSSALEAALPVRDVVAQGRYPFRSIWGRPERGDEAAIAAALAQFTLTDLADRPYNRLSHGERRRVLLARAVATAAPLLLLDEPTAALDVSHTLALFALLGQLAQEGRGVVVVLHHLQEAMVLGDRALLLDEGRVVAQGTAAEVIAPDPIRRVYQVELIPGAQFGFARLPGPGARR